MSVNQCDGCRRGLAFSDEEALIAGSRIHVDEKGHAVMGCTKDLYVFEAVKELADQIHQLVIDANADVEKIIIDAGVNLFSAQNYRDWFNRLLAEKIYGAIVSEKDETIHQLRQEVAELQPTLVQDLNAQSVSIVSRNGRQEFVQINSDRRKAELAVIEAARYVNNCCGCTSAKELANALTAYDNLTRGEK